MPTRRRLVIDASVTRAAGNETAIDPVSVCCRELLKDVRRICHHLVMTPNMMDEWKQNRSRFSSTWLTSMYSRKKVENFPDEDSSSLIGKISQIGRSRKENEAMFKDLHLVMAASATDRIIVSLDEKAKGLF